MTIPIAHNTTCDIYRNGNVPPSDPDVEGVRIRLTSSYRRRKETGENMPVTNRYTHVALVETSVDVRDGWIDFTGESGADTVYIPDQNGGSYKVIFVERKDRGLPTDHKRVYLHRDQADWDNLY